jgi:polysaccharide pyruvyl transferase WcaK-like protein
MKYLDLMITDRYHVVIFSIIAPVPVLGLKTQSIKMDGLFQLMEYPYPVQSLETLKSIELADQIDQILGRKNEINRILSNACHVLQKRAFNDLKRIPNDIYEPFQ